MTDIVSIRHGDELLAIIIPAAYHADGIQFFTPGTFSQQLGYMSHPAGYEILPHDHNPVPRTVEWTQEVLFVRSGKIRMDIYAPGSRVYLESRKRQMCIRDSSCQEILFFWPMAVMVLLCLNLQK